jgi:TRAP-type C4-dicarboxylate transport system permease small subunit
MRKYLNKLYTASGWTAALFILSICVLVMAQVTLNLIDKIAAATIGTAIGLTVPSYSDFTGFFLAAASFLALAYTLREGGHIRVSLVIQQLSPRFQRITDIWSIALGGATTLYFTWYTALLTHESYSYHDLSSGMVAVPLWIPQMGMLVGLIVLSIAFIDELFAVLSGNDPSFAGKSENLLDDSSTVASSAEPSNEGAG